MLPYTLFLICLHIGENKFILVDQQEYCERGIRGTQAKLQTEKRRTSVVLYIPDVNQPKMAELRTASNVSIYSTVYQSPLLLGYGKRQNDIHHLNPQPVLLKLALSVVVGFFVVVVVVIFSKLNVW